VEHLGIRRQGKRLGIRLGESFHKKLFNNGLRDLLGIFKKLYGLKGAMNIERVVRIEIYEAGKVGELKGSSLRV